MLRAIFGAMALISLLICLTLPVLFFQGSLTNDAYKNLFAVASAGWFVFAIGWASQGRAGQH